MVWLPSFVAADAMLVKNKTALVFAAEGGLVILPGRHEDSVKRGWLKSYFRFSTTTRPSAFR